MIHLLVNDANADENPSDQTKFGGKPSAPEGRLAWPTCRTCQGNMQFLGQLRMDEPPAGKLLLLFMCQNDPGLCEDWDASAGGNHIITVPVHDLQLVEPPSKGETLRPTRHGAVVTPIDATDYDEARTKWASTNDKCPRQVLGQVGGKPSWIQGEEVPRCDSCGETMAFVAQLEQGPDWNTEMNFGGGGCAYVFRCTCTEASVKLLWQS